MTIPEKKGIDLSTATNLEIKAYLTDNTIKKSSAIISLCEKIIYLKSNTELDIKKEKLYSDERKQTKNDIEFLGKSGIIRKDKTEAKKITL